MVFWFNVATLAAARVPLLMLLALVVSVVALAAKPASVGVWFIHFEVELSYAKSSLSPTDVTVTSDYTDSGAITTGLPSSSEAHYCVYGTKTSGVMGKQISKFVAHPDDTSNDWLYYASAQVATPIHTSHHYQTFETHFSYHSKGNPKPMWNTLSVIYSQQNKTP